MNHPVYLSGKSYPLGPPAVLVVRCTLFKSMILITANREVMSDILSLKSFYVDNCLHCFHTAEEARKFVNQIRVLLAEGGFELRQWSSNQLTTISHLLPELKSASTELWITHGRTETSESALGLLWNHQRDTLSYNTTLLVTSSRIPTELSF